jgi:hypothetical protein
LLSDPEWDKPRGTGLRLLSDPRNVSDNRIDDRSAERNEKSDERRNRKNGER